MCLLLIAHQMHSRYGLVIAANRDEFFARPTAALDYWQDMPHVLAGRDLSGQGTWFGISSHGDLAAITNYRNPHRNIANAPTRGRLVSEFIANAHLAPPTYMASLERNAGRYNGFNLIVGRVGNLWYFSNRSSDHAQQLPPGYYAISNHLLDTPWPKVVKGKAKLKKVLQSNEHLPEAMLFDILADRDIPEDKQLPDTGVGLAWERRLAPLFITSPEYGTRSSTLLLIEHSGKTTLVERSFKTDGSGRTASPDRVFHLQLPGNRAN